MLCRGVQKAVASLLKPALPLALGGALLGVVKASEDHLVPPEYPWDHKGLFSSFDATRYGGSPAAPSSTRAWREGVCSPPTPTHAPHACTNAMPGVCKRARG